MITHLVITLISAILAGHLFGHSSGVSFGQPSTFHYGAIVGLDLPGYGSIAQLATRHTAVEHTIGLERHQTGYNAPSAHIRPVGHSRSQNGPTPFLAHSRLSPVADHAIDHADIYHADPTGQIDSVDNRIVYSYSVTLWRGFGYPQYQGTISGMDIVKGHPVNYNQISSRAYVQKSKFLAISNPAIFLPCVIIWTRTYTRGLQRIENASIFQQSNHQRSCNQLTI